MISFIISTCIRNELHLNQLKRCILSVNTFHKESKIFLIDDSDERYNLIIKNAMLNINNVIIIDSIKKGSADQQCFKLILDNNDNSSHYIIIQDSMFLNRMIDNVDVIESIKFLWHFTNHRIDWDKIHEPQTDFNIKNSIKTHTDLIRYHLINNYYEDADFLKYALEYLQNKNKWVGCFGNCCIITKTCVEILNKNTNFIEKFINNNTNRERRMNESIFSLLCYYYLPQEYENSYDGLYYDGVNVNKYSNIETGFDGLKYCCKNKYISKISFDR